MSWQQNRNPGSPIYRAYRWLDKIHLKVMYRVIHNATSLGIDTKRCVRYQNRWYPLHEPEELAPFYISEEGARIPVVIGDRLFSEADKKLPFVRTWECPGPYYQVFGYSL